MAACLKVTEDVCFFVKETLKALQECGLLESYSVSYQVKVSFPTDFRLNSDVASHLYIVREELSKLSAKFSSSTLRSMTISQGTNANYLNELPHVANTVRPVSQSLLPEHGVTEHHKSLSGTSKCEETCNEITVEDSYQSSQTSLEHVSVASTHNQMADEAENISLSCHVMESLREDSNQSTSQNVDNIPRVSSRLSDESSDRCMNLSPEPPTEKFTFDCNSCDKQFRYMKNLVSHKHEKHGIGDTKKKAIDLTCDVCDKVFVNKQRLGVHRASHMTLKPFSCAICGMMFAQKSTRDNHLSQHTGSFKYSCKECPKSFVNQAKLNFHMHKHQEPRHICEYCGKTFVRKDVFDSHVKRHDPSKNHLCAICGKAFRSKTFLKRHEMSDHSPNADSVLHSCAQCDATFRKKPNLERHLETHISPVIISTETTKVTNKKRSKTPLNKEQKAKSLENQEKLFSCTQCTRTYKFKHNLKVHEKSHKESSMDIIKPHKCPNCSKQFSKKFRLDLHIKTHQQAPDLSCEICGQRFYRREVLRNHIFLHTNQRPYKCDLCEKAFASKTNLTVHMSSHSTQDQDHSEGTFVCDYCQRKFKQKASFNTHLKAHRGEFQFECHICNKKFVRKGHFEGHLRSHSKNRPHLCPVCEKGFKEKKHRREHLKRMHPNEFNLDTLFASITTEDVQIAEMITMSDQQSDAIPLQFSLLFFYNIWTMLDQTRSPPALASTLSWNPVEYLDVNNTNMQFVVVILNCPIESPRDSVISLWNRALLRVTVDGGTDRWQTFLNGTECMPPEFITGDMDSVSPETLEHYQRLGTKLIRTPNQDETDFTKALRHIQNHLRANNIKIDGVVTLADTSGRLDQILANINTLFKAVEIFSGIPVYQLAGNSLTWLLQPGCHRIMIPEKMQKMWCSLMPIGSKANRVSTTGLRWNLDNQSLEFGGIVSTSNTYDGSTLVTIKTDGLLVWSMGLKHS